MQKITPCIWFNDTAEEAVKFYLSLFPKSKKGRVARYDEESAKVSGRPKGSVLTIDFSLNGQEFLALNGGPIFTLNPSISFFVHRPTVKEVDSLFSKLSKGGEVMMALGKYPFSERYAFFKDRFGVSWQIMLSPKKTHIAPCLLFVNESLGKAQNAVALYRKVFKKSKLNHMQLYGNEMPGMKGKVMHSSFSLFGQEFMAMDGPGKHAFSFNESMSFIVNCKNQKEVDRYWKALVSQGGEESQCGWLKDRFGVSWQIAPIILNEMLLDKNKKKASRAMKAMLGMRKIVIADLLKAFDSA